VPPGKINFDGRGAFRIVDGPEGPVQHALASVKGLVVPPQAIGPGALGGSVQIRKFFEVRLAAVLGGTAGQNAAWRGKAAQQGGNHQSGAAHLKRIAVARGHPAGMPDNVRGCFRQHMGQIFDGLGLHAAFIGGPGSRVGGDKGAQLLKTGSMGGHIILIIEALGNEGVDDCQIEGVVAAGPDDKDVIGLGGRDSMPDIYDGKFAAAAQGPHHGARLAHIESFKNVAGLQHNMFAIGVVVDHHAPPVAKHGLAGVVRIKVAGRAVRAHVGRTQPAHKGAVQVGKGAFTV